MKPIETAEYKIFINSWEQLIATVEKGVYSKVVILVDQNTERHCLPILEKNVDFSFEFISIPAGENHKSIETLSVIWKALLNLEADRKSLLINLGGGVIGDMGGFAASTFMRGMDFIQLPTTLLSMVDASIGGKLGIDFNGVKNLVGLFKNPNTIIVFPGFLKTLPKRELHSGKAEMYKHGLIADKSYYNMIVDLQSDEIDWTDLIYRSIEIKNRVVSQDPTEQGVRKILNFGHTIGHALEILNLDRASHLLHGEAIILGMIAESFISYKKGKLTISALESVINGFDKKYDFPDAIDLDPEKIVALCLRDKKNENQKILASLIDGVGSCAYNVEVTAEEISEALDFLKQFLSN